MLAKGAQTAGDANAFLASETNFDLGEGYHSLRKDICELIVNDRLSVYVPWFGAPGVYYAVVSAQFEKGSDDRLKIVFGTTEWALVHIDFLVRFGIFDSLSHPDFMFHIASETPSSEKRVSMAKVDLLPYTDNPAARELQDPESASLDRIAAAQTGLALSALVPADAQPAGATAPLNLYTQNAMAKATGALKPVYAALGPNMESSINDIVKVAVLHGFVAGMEKCMNEYPYA